MGKTLLFIGILFGGTNVVVSQGSDIDYYADAIQLAARAASNLNESAEIPADITAELTVALEAVANSGGEAAELVTQRLNIHAFQYANTENTQVYVDANAQWVQKLMKEKSSIEQTPLRKFAAMYDLRLTSITNLDGILKLSLRSETAQNMKYIANEISMVDDVIMVELPAQIGDGHDIKAKRINGGWIISYVYKFQDCPIGCRKQCEWQFGVNNSGRVEYLGLYGEIPNDILDTPFVVMQNND